MRAPDRGIRFSPVIAHDPALRCAPMTGPVELHFEHGTLVAAALPEDAVLRALFVLDSRTGVWRAPAWRYREIALHLHRSGLPWEDRARDFSPIELPLTRPLVPRPYQSAALAAWLAAGKRGTVVLPTGAGKTIFGIMAISAAGRPTLVVVPTLVLLQQWHEELVQWLGEPVGIVGGGVSDRQRITVTTYDSAALHMEFNGRRFGMLVLDECHHLPGPTTSFVAQGAIAPFRLALTATLERPDGGERVVEQLVGPVVHREEITGLEGRYLAPYEIVDVDVALEPDEQEQYDAARARYTEFLRAEGIQLGTPAAWRTFIARAARSEEGRAAFGGWREQRRIAITGRGKLEALWEILRRHRGERVVVFTEDNATVHRLSRWLLAPAITHHTPGPERARVLRAFAEGRWPVLLTSKVLNEGVDVPDAGVGVVLSGSGSVREHVQRLGRLLRRREGKRAVLYELRSAGTAETGISERRRQHSAYQRAAGVQDRPGRPGDAAVREPAGADAAGAGGAADRLRGDSDG